MVSKNLLSCDFFLPTHSYDLSEIFNSKTYVMKITSLYILKNSLTKKNYKVI